MTYEEALELVKSEFELRKDADHCHIIKTGLTYDGCQGFCVAVYRKTDGSVILTDIGETKEVFDEVTEDEWKQMCESHGFEFNHWRIEHSLDTMEDVYNYINFIDWISDKFFMLDDED